jgi:hypothetical protein
MYDEDDRSFLGRGKVNDVYEHAVAAFSQLKVWSVLADHIKRTASKRI